jgi:hypothetical protein
MHQLKPKKQVNPARKNSDYQQPGVEADNDSHANATGEVNPNEKSSPAEAARAVTNQAEQDKITNADNASPLNEKENEGD